MVPKTNENYLKIFHSRINLVNIVKCEGGCYTLGFRNVKPDVIYNSKESKDG